MVPGGGVCPNTVCMVPEFKGVPPLPTVIKAPAGGKGEGGEGEGGGGGGDGDAGDV